MRRAPNPAITAQMYRHFATMTVALTALVAFFASGEKRTAVAAQPVATRPATPAPAPAPPPQSDDSDDTGSWGSDDGGDFGHPTAAAYSSAGSWFSNPFGGDGNRPALAGAPVVPGLDGDEDDSNATGEKAQAPAPPSAADIAAATAASKLRSGAAGND
jgi:hypothetical protein